ncbi:MAG: GYD domain-containing protein [Acidobacteriota bacterium]
MPLFILMTKMSPESMHDVNRRKAMGKDWIRKVADLCPGVKFLAHYAILGPYDFMDIYEAPDVESAQRVSLISRVEGAVSAESWEALPYEKYLRILGEVAP